MNLNDKQDCNEQFAKTLDRTSAWRRKTASKYPDDPRNLKAAEMLDRLAIESTNLTDEHWEKLRPHFGWNSQTFYDALIQAAKLVGFAHRNSTFDSFVRLVVKQLPVSRVAA
jgi:predicted aminopeptidase